MAESSSSAGTLFFYKEMEEGGFMSQFYPCHFSEPSPVDPKVINSFNAAEQYMMYHKAMCFDDRDTAKKVLAAKKPMEQKALGRKVKGFTEKKWIHHKEAIVEQGNWLKFTQSREKAELTDKLLVTGDRELVEAAARDRVWGIGFSAGNAEANRHRWGQNLLGQALMRIRGRIRERDQADAGERNGAEGEVASEP